MRLKRKYLILLAQPLLTALTAVKNKIPNVIISDKRTDYNTNIGKIENKITTDHDYFKYTTTQEFNTLRSENATLRLAKANLAGKNGISNFVQKTDFDNKLKYVTSNKNELNILPKKVRAMSTKRLIKDLINRFSIINGANHFSSGIFQNYLVFIPGKKQSNYFNGTTWIDS